MEEKIKEIVSIYTKIPAEQIGPSTIIDRSAVDSSIMLHRMYAKLSEQGFTVQDYWDVKNFGSLLQRVNGNSIDQDEIPGTVHPSAPSYADAHERSAAGIGIDIEEIDAMPQTNDFREDAFYKMHFCAPEMAYCILQPDPYASFAGLYAAKEAIVKADNNYKSKAFHTIVIGHSASGKPSHSYFNLSISHTRATAVAVAVRSQQSALPLQDQFQNKPAQNFSLPFLLVLVSLLLSLLAIYFAWRRN